MGMADKKAFLSGDIMEAMGKFTCHEVDETNYTLAPAKPFDEKLYAKFWPVSSEDGSVAIFKKHCSGISNVFLENLSFKDGLITSLFNSFLNLSNLFLHKE